MLSEWRKSINAVLYERVTSPLYGTFIITWAIWNWKIIYLTLFVSESEIDSTKIDYIITNYYDIYNLLVYPVISTIVIIAGFSFISNGAYWLHLKFKQWRIDAKNEIEKNQLLTLEQSINIRKELREKEKEFQELLSNKDLEIELLEREIAASINSDEDKMEEPFTPMSDEKYLKEYSNFKNNESVYEYFNEAAEIVRKQNRYPGRTPTDARDYYSVNGIIELDNGGRPFLTDKGKAFYKFYYNKHFGDKK